VDVDVDRSVGDATTGAAAVEVSEAVTAVAASVGVNVDVGEVVVIAKGVALMNAVLDDGDGLGVAVSASGMINGGKVGISAKVGVGVARGVGVCDEN